MSGRAPRVRNRPKYRGRERCGRAGRNLRSARRRTRAGFFDAAIRIAMRPASPSVSSPLPRAARPCSVASGDLRPAAAVGTQSNRRGHTRRLIGLRAIMDKRPSNHSGPHNARGVNSGTPVVRDSELLKGIGCSEEPRTASSTVRWLPAVSTISGRPDKARSNVMLLRSMSLNVFSECEPKGTEISLPTMPSCSRGRKLKAKESPRYQRVAGHL